MATCPLPPASPSRTAPRQPTLGEIEAAIMPMVARIGRAHLVGRRIAMSDALADLGLDAIDLVATADALRGTIGADIALTLLPPAPPLTGDQP